MFHKRKDSDGQKKPSTFSRIFGRAKSPAAPSSYQAPAGQNQFQTQSTHRPTPSIASSTTVVERPSAPQPPPAAAASADDSFNLRVTKDLWPESSPGEDAMQGVGQLFFDFTDSSQKLWAKGADTGIAFGRSIFPAKQNLPSTLPSRLFDLAEGRVVSTQGWNGVEYTVISHVWGEETSLTSLDGQTYGVEWNIPIRRKAKLDQMFTAARIIGGLRYLWIDILCLDQRTKNESEVARMGEYYANASGCIVWLDNAHEGHDWNTVLNTIEQVNQFFKMDKSGVSTVSVEEMMRDGLLNLSLSGNEAFQWVRKIVTIEKAVWFKRLWTLQEAVIPENLYFCTPERYMVGSAPLFQLIGLCGMVAKALTEAGAMAGVAVTHELQKSEVWKILRLRQLYRKNRLGYWHLIQASKTRSCKIEQDRVFGLLGMVQGRKPVVDYTRTLKDLYEDIYKSSLEQSEFSTLAFLGDGDTPLIPDARCMPLIIAGASDVPETHSITMQPNFITLQGVGYDAVKRVWSIITNGSLRIWESPAFLDLSSADHVDIAKAFGMPTNVYNKLCPGAFAAISSMSPLPENILKAFGQEFLEVYERLTPHGLLVWARATFMMQASEDNAFVVIWTASSDPMLAIVTEKVDGTVVVVTPSSYASNPGEGCIICKVLPAGTLKKIGVGFGMQVKAGQTATLALATA